MRSDQRTNSTADHGLELSPAAVEEMRGKLSAVADDVVAAIVDEVPSYRDAFSGPMGETIRNAVQLALGGFLTLASRGRAEDLRTPTAPAVEGSYQLGRGEARSGRSTDALLAAFRIGARVSWRELSEIAVRNGAARRRAGRLRRAGLRLHRRAVRGRGRRPHRRDSRPPAGSDSGCSSASPHSCSRALPPRRSAAAAERAGWTPPTTLTAVLVPESQVRPVLGAGLGGTIQATEDCPGLDEGALLLVPDAHGRRRTALLRTLARPRLDRRAGRPLARGPRGRSTGRCGPVSSASSSTPRPSCPGWSCTPTSPRSPTSAPGSWRRSTPSGPAHRRQARRHAARLAAAPGPPRRDRRGAVRAPADGALPDGPAPRRSTATSWRTPTRSGPHAGVA